MDLYKSMSLEAAKIQLYRILPKKTTKNQN